VQIKLYNSLTKDVEIFKPINPELVTMYLCGPTVYDYVHIGNYRTYTLGDVLHRTLNFNNYKTKYVMNLTDVGHLSGDNTGDADSGEDRLEASAEREGKSAREIADYYIDDFFKGVEKLNFLKPEKYARATEYIDQQIDLIKTLEKNGYTYETTDGVYFDTSKFDEYGELSGIDKEAMKEGARVDANAEKLNPTDFALWKFSPKDKKRWQEWDSPWGVGFPGWHLECSAMSMEELGDTIDIHAGGEDLKMIHHPNEIAQSECATGMKFVNYWLHGAFLQVDGGRMGKSLGNAYTMDDIEHKGFEPMALRYFYLTAHYRSTLNFTWEALQGAQNALKKLYDIVGSYKESIEAQPSQRFLMKFNEQINEDLNMPKAMATMWDMLKSDLPEPEKLVTALKMDEVLGFNIVDYIGFEIPQKIVDLATTRSEYRKAGIWDKADIIRKQISEMGYVVEDLPNNKFKVKRKM
jgi:cysteinyl-tRNA synthetase